MGRLLWSVLAPIISLGLFILGSGLFQTFQSVRLHVDGVPSALIGAVAGATAAGMVLGSRFSQHWIARIGHIRAFAAFASSIAAVTMLQGLWPNPWSWIALRLLSGFCIAGLYIVIESWLLEGSTPQTRGRVLSIYMITFYVAQGSGQLLLDVGDPSGLLLFCIPVILISLSIFPVSITKNPSPSLPSHTYISMRQLYSIAPAGVWGSLFAGMILGSFYGLGPIFVQEMGLPLHQVGLAMALWVLGGFTLQWPIGHLSDYCDRRLMIALISLLTGGLAVGIAWLTPLSNGALLTAIAAFGGLAFTIYPLSISHASDRVAQGHLVATTASMLFLYGVGSIIGPLVAPLAMMALGTHGLMLFIAALGGMMALFALWRRTQRSAVAEEEKRDFVPLPRRGPISHELNPQLEPVQQEQPARQDEVERTQHPTSEVTD